MGSAACVATLLTLLTVVSFLGAWSYLGDLLACLRLQLAIVGGIAATYFLLRRQWRPLLFSIAVCIVHGTIIAGPVLSSAHRIQEPVTELRVLRINLAGSPEESRRGLRFVQECRPDLLIITACSPAVRMQLRNTLIELWDGAYHELRSNHRYEHTSLLSSEEHEAVVADDLEPKSLVRASCPGVLGEQQRTPNSFCMNILERTSDHATSVPLAP